MCYIRVLAELYQHQIGFIGRGSCSSRSFPIRRGTKQGDPLSPALFISVLDDILRRAQPIWRRKGYGISLGSNDADILTNLRFADDLLLVASSEKQIRTMLEDLMKEAGEVGLQIHTGKTKILANREIAMLRSLRIGGKSVDILPKTESTEYLGRKLCLRALHDTEINARLDKAWRNLCQ